MLLRPHVDHDQPRRAFLAALEGEPLHVFTIRAASGKGKSTLLGCFRRECREHDAPVALLDFRALRGRDAFELLGLVCRYLRPLAFPAYQAGISEHLETALGRGAAGQKFAVRLSEALVKHFGEEGLRGLCFGLGLEYADLPAEGRPGKARELVKHLERRGRLAELAERVEQLRPSVSLGAVPETTRQPPTRLEAIPPDRLPADLAHRRAILSRLTDALLGDLRAGCAQSRVVLLLDTYEQAGDDIKDWLAEQFLPEACEVEGLVIVVAGQETPELDPAHWGDVYRHFDLPEGLLWEDWLEYAEEVGALSDLGESILRRYYEHARGDPKAMCTYCDPFGAEAL